MKQVSSLSELKRALPKEKPSYLLLYKSGSETGACAIDALKKTELKNTVVFTADVAKVRDIHPEYGIKSVPTLLSFENGEFKSTYKGCNSPEFYHSVFNNSLFSTSGSDEQKSKQKPVTVYSTPTCTWCNRIKSYFKEKGIKYKDIDVSKDQKAAEAMMKKSGQQGVPQTTIGGEHIVGFDKAKIDKLLNLD